MSDLLNQASLVYIPSGYKEDTAYSVIPTDGSGDLTFTRASDGTRVNSQGLVERVPWNLVIDSEDITSANWTPINVTRTANQITSPSGSIDADLINAGTSSGGHYVQNATTYFTSGATYTFSGFAKKGNTSLIQLVGNSTAFGSNVWASYNFDTLEVTAGSASTASMVDYGNGWYRLILTGACISSQTAQSFFYVFTNDKNTRVPSFTGSNETAYVWGAQANIGSTAKPYFPTTDRLDVPRLDYSNGCPSLLLEPQRTNSFTYSESFANYYVNRATATDLGTPSIFSSGSIARFTATAADARFGKVIGSVTSGSTYTVSGFFDLSEGIYAGISDSSGNYRIFNLLTASVVGSGGGTLTISCKSDRVALTNYYRVAFTFTANTTGNHFFVIGKNDGTISTTNETVAAGYFQREDSASYPTSYIPTTSASVTRVADAASKTGISSLIGQTEGVIFLDAIFPDVNTGQVFMELTGSGTDVNFQINGTTLYFYSATNWSISTTISANTRYKIAGAYKANDIVLYVNGVQIGVDSVATIAAKSNLYVNTQSTGSYLTPMQINQALLFKTRLTNAELASLTTL